MRLQKAYLVLLRLDIRAPSTLNQRGAWQNQARCNKVPAVLKHPGRHRRL